MSFWCPFLATSFVIHLASIAVRWKSMTTLIPHTSARKDHTMQINRGKSASLHCESWLPATSQSQNHSIIRRWNPTVTSKITSLLLPQKILDRRILDHTDCTWEISKLVPVKGIKTMTKSCAGLAKYISGVWRERKGWELYWRVLAHGSQRPSDIDQKTIRSRISGVSKYCR